MAIVVFLLLVLGAIGLAWGLYLEHKIEQNKGVWHGRYRGDADFDQLVGVSLLAIGVILELALIIFHVLRAIWLGLI